MYKGTTIGIGTDAKTPKGEKLENPVMTGVQYLAPARTSGIANLCSHSTIGCEEVCIFNTGRGMMTTTQQHRLNRTVQFVQNKAEYMLKLEKDIEALIRKADKKNMIPSVRLNGTSDLPWERMPFVGKNGWRYASILQRFPQVKWYDYTKNPHRAKQQPYHLTYSRAETADSHKYSLELLASGVNVAVVFGITNKKQSNDEMLPLPKTWNGYKVIDGDVSDVRFYDEQGVVVGLRFKTSRGQALDGSTDASGFVVAVDWIDGEPIARV